MSGSPTQLEPKSDPQYWSRRRGLGWRNQVPEILKLLPQVTTDLRGSKAKRSKQKPLFMHAHVSMHKGKGDVFQCSKLLAPSPNTSACLRYHGTAEQDWGRLRWEGPPQFCELFRGKCGQAISKMDLGRSGRLQYLLNSLGSSDAFFKRGHITLPPPEQLEVDTDELIIGLSWFNRPALADFLSHEG